MYNKYKLIDKNIINYKEILSTKMSYKIHILNEIG